MNNNPELNEHLERNESMWHVQKENGIDSETELVVNFHFYSTRKENTELLCKALSDENIPYSIEKTRTLIFLKGWNIETDIKKKWTLVELQEKTKTMFLLAEQNGVSLEGCGAFMPN